MTRVGRIGTCLASSSAVMAASSNYWRKEGNYSHLPFSSSSSSRNSSSGNLSLNEQAYPDYSHHGPTSASHRLAGLASALVAGVCRRRLLLLLHLTSLSFGVFGVCALTALKHGKLMYTPVYSKYDIAQAGYNRNLVTPQPSTLTGSGTLSNLDISEQDRISPGFVEAHPQDGRETFLDSWTFPSSPSLGLASALLEPKSSDQHLLILSPIRNAHDTLPTYFRHLENLQHPKSNTSLGFLLSDEEDETGILVQHWCDEQLAKGEYRQITLLRKDFGLFTPRGGARHEDWVQAQRRALMARARTLLLMSTINPTVDWVFWLDVDVKEMPSAIISDLMLYGRLDGQGQGEGHDSLPASTVLADIITPNIMDINKGHIRGYDLNNWAETSESQRLKQTLDPDVILHEGDVNLPTHRLHLARQWVPPNVTLSPFQPTVAGNSDTSSEEASDLYDPSSDAYIGRQIPLDAVGGVATLVRASVHLFGGIFPSWNVDHAVETEGFGILAKLVGARVIGLPNYLVVHR